MTILILTYHKAYNCGAMLQAWALRTVIERMGHHVEFVTCNGLRGINAFLPIRWSTSPLRLLYSIFNCTLHNILAIPAGKLAERRYKAFVKGHLPERNISPHHFARHYNAAVIGSDQVWNKFLAGERFSFFSGECLGTSLPHISYAASYGDRPLTPEETAVMKAALLHYKAISVRERHAQEELHQLTGRNIALTLDPTLLLTAEDYRVITRPMRHKRPYLYAYLVSGTQHIDLIKRLAHALGVDYIITPIYITSYFRAPRGVTLGVSPDRMLGYMANARYVFAASFHGTVFALLNKKPFVSLVKDLDDTSSRVGSFLSQLNLTNRMISHELKLDEIVDRIKTPIPEMAHTECLPKLRKASLDWLKISLEMLK